jgi:drug/metabolite transporter (DMT)-like permease
MRAKTSSLLAFKYERLDRMSLLSIFLVLTSAALHVWWNYLTKASQNPKAFSLIKGLMILALALSVLSFIPLSDISSRVWFFLVLSGIIHALYSLSLASAYEVGDISFVYPIARSAPAFVPIAAFLVIGEQISLRGGIGIVITVVAVWIMQIRGDFGLEIKHLWKVLKKRDSMWAFITLFSVIVYTIIDKQGMVAFNDVPEIDPWVQGPVYFLLEASISYIIFWTYAILHLKIDVRPTFKSEWPKAAVAAVCTMASYSLILFVMKTEIVSYVVTLRQCSVVFAVLIGWIVLKEKYGKRRLFASLLMFSGLYFVATA